jgi:hypothetical protein
LYPNFFTSPIQDQENQKRLILTTGIPINNPHTYIETISPNSWSVYMIARLSTQEPLESIQPLSNNILEKIAYIHTIYDYEMLPYNEFIVPFIEAVQAAGAGTFIPDYSKNIEFNNCDSIERFPEIIYSFYQRESNQLAKRVVDIRLYPSDYAMAIPGPERKCLTFLRSHRLTNGVTSSSIIGANLLHTISVHFDSENRRIGFADPPNE